MNFKKSPLIIFLIISMLLLSSCEVYQTLYGNNSKRGPENTEPGQVIRVEGDLAKDPAILAKTAYGAASATQHDPFKLGENPLGPFEKGRSLGFSLEQWLGASGIGIYSVDGDKASLELSFKNLVPNGVYSVWCSRLTMPPDFSVQDKPCGAEDGTQNSLAADGKGLASFSLSMNPLEPSTKETASIIALAYHSDGKTYGSSPGDFGMNSHVQLFFMMPVPAANATKYEVPLKFTNHLAAGMPEQDVFIEKEQPPVPTGEVVENKTEETNRGTEPVPSEIKQPRPAEGQPKEKPVVVTVQETDKVSLSPEAEDPDKGTSITFTFTSPLDDKGEWQTNYGDAGQYTITVTASDGELTTSRDALIIVNKKEETPTIDNAKPIESGLNIDEKQSIDFSAEASDLNRDTLSYSWKLDGAESGDDTKFTYQTDYDSAGSHTVKVDVSDGTSTASKLWSVNVRNVNRAPALEKVGDINVKETDKIAITALATDADSDPITYSISDGKYAQENNVFTWETNYDSAGTYEVTVSASDGKDTTSQKFTVVVDNVDRAPVIKDIVQKK